MPKSMRNIRIVPVLNGFIVEVGCQTLVFNRIEDVAEKLVAYQKNPEAVEKLFIENSVNNTMSNQPMVAEPERYRGHPSTCGTVADGRN